MNQIPDIQPSEGFTLPEPEVKPRNKVLDLLAALIYPMLLFISQYVTIFAAELIVVVQALNKGVAESELEGYVIGVLETHLNEVVIAADLLIILVLVLWFGCRRKGIAKSLEMNPVKVSTLFLGVAAGIGLNCALDFVMNWILPLFPEAMNEYNEHMSNEGSMIAYLLSGVVLAPIVEELLFRALSVKHLDRVLPRGLSMVVVAGIFGLMHNNLVQGLYAGSLGLLLCCIFFAYRSVWVPMAVHLGFNMVSLLSLFDVESMNDAQLLIYTVFVQLFVLIAAFGGIVAMVFLFLKRTHPIWFKVRGNEKKESIDPAR